jgi:hypothetical protein
MRRINPALPGKHPNPFSQIMLTIYKPGENPVRRLRTSLKGAQLPDGYYQAINNLRWDSGALTVRNGISTVSGSAPGTACLGAWSGSLNGTYYVVSAWIVSGKTAIYSLDLGSGNFAELTNPGNVTNASSWGGDSNGKTEFDNTTADVKFTVATTPRRVVGGTAVAPRDLLVIQNGSDYPLIYDPSQTGNNPKVVVHKKITLPDGALSFKGIATLSQFFQVKGNSGEKTFASSAGTPKVNQAGYIFLGNTWPSTPRRHVASGPARSIGRHDALHPAGEDHRERQLAEGRIVGNIDRHAKHVVASPAKVFAKDRKVR